MILLPNVTIICVNGSDSETGVKALKYSMQNITFGQSLMLTNKKPTNLTDSITYKQIPNLTHQTYSPFILHELHKYIETDFCLIIQDDGFVINPHLWRDEFLNYDYIGAPWTPIYHVPGHGTVRVGNGGFSLRSKKFINLCQHLECHNQHEDGVCCINYRDFMIKNGCKYAPLEVAMKFSLERQISECEYNLDNCFGFHGKQFTDKIKLLDAIE